MSLFLQDIHFMPDFRVNLISKGQLQKEEYDLKIVLGKIKIRPNRILVKLIENKLYDFDIISF